MIELISRQTKESDRTLQELRHERFKTPSANSTIDSTDDMALAPSDYSQTPIVTVFSMSSIVTIHHDELDAVCCGGFSDHYIVHFIVVSVGYTLSSTIKSSPVSNEYRRIVLHVVHSHDVDYVKNVTRHGYNNGHMQNQSFKFTSMGSNHHNSQRPELDPKALVYSWLAYWHR